MFTTNAERWMQIADTAKVRLDDGSGAASVARRERSRLWWLLLLCISGADPSAQQLLDRIVARVGANAITLTDLQAARALGVVAGATDQEVLQQMINRQLLLIEVARFPPADPPEAAVAAQVARERAAAGRGLDALMEATGTDEAHLRDLARDTLRIDGYIEQRFGTSIQVTDAEAAAYYGEHPDEFRRNGAVIPFDEALPIVRERANAERRKAQVDRWLQDLRGRADIVIPTATPAR